MKQLRFKLKLKPCPNCGNPKIWRVYGSVSKWWVECTKCHWCGKNSRIRLLAELKWNRQAGEHK